MGGRRDGRKGLDYLLIKPLGGLTEITHVSCLAQCLVKIRSLVSKWSFTFTKSSP